MAIDILCLQETSAFHNQEHLNENQITQFQNTFTNKAHILTKHCAIICLNDKYNIEDTCITRDERSITARIIDKQGATMCHISNIYALAQQKERREFFGRYHSLPQFENITREPHLLVGDFNSSVPDSWLESNRDSDWIKWLKIHFFNCFPQHEPTFKRGNIRTNIDFILAHHHLESRITNPRTQYLPYEWTDHTLLQIDLQLPRTDIGPGVWRLNPNILGKEEFVTLLKHTMNLLFDSELVGHSIQHQWEMLKVTLKCTAQRFCKEYKVRTKDSIQQLQKARTTAFQVSKVADLDQTVKDQLHQQIQKLEDIIEEKTIDETKQHLLISATRWHEKGERSNKYFFHVIKQRQTQQTLQSIKSVTMGKLATTNGEILKEARSFYQNLYTPEEIDQTAVKTLLTSIPSDCRLTTDEAATLQHYVTENELDSLIKQSPTGKSPGLDGIPFEMYQFLLEHFPKAKALLLNVMQQALDGKYPQSWQQTRMVLLFKKGDPQLLKNWRPLSLINCDAKLFTKMITNRIKNIAVRLINPYQTGFLPNRLISDNGLVSHTIMNHFQEAAPSQPMVAVLLDQEKAYDRVHPRYLNAVLSHFGFPSSIMKVLSSLFFSTKINLSINGWLVPAFTQSRGLRQGDPLSSILFNLAMEPLLRHLLTSPSIPGIRLPTLPKRKRHWPKATQMIEDEPEPLKLLSYADDLQVFLTEISEWKSLTEILEIYGKASNAKVNLEKIVVISLSGQSNGAWIDLLTPLKIKWHDKNDPSPVVQLGYPKYSSQKQLQVFLDQMEIKIQRHINLLQERNLSIRGAGLVTNSLLLSKLWHVLRVIPAPTPWLDKIKTSIRRFLLPFWPRPSWSTLCLDKKHGGIGLVDVHHQNLALHLIYVQRIIRPRKDDFVAKFIRRISQIYTGQRSLLPIIMMPSRYRNCVSAIPTLAHLCSLLMKLPTLRPLEATKPSEAWSKEWLEDIPLCAALETQPTKIENLPDIPIQYLTADILRVNDRMIRRMLYPHNYTSVDLMMKIAGDIKAGRRRWTAWMVAGLRADIDNSEDTKSLMPSCDHWTLPTIGKQTKTQMSTVSIKQCRRYWHPQFQWIMQPPTPPILMPPVWRVASKTWKLLWSLNIPSKAYTTWWRPSP